jgi:hypothetical protein
MQTFIRSHWPLILALIIFGLILEMLYFDSVLMNEGHLVYSLDDAYIHMAMAKNFSQHGVWGITRYEFSSSSSSLLWTFLLSIFYFLFGVNEITPLLLNILFSIIAVITFYILLRDYHLPQVLILLVLMEFIFLTPLPGLVFTGLENLLHTLLTLLFVYFSVRDLSTEKPLLWNSNSIRALVLAPLVTSVRYEGLFVVFVVCVLLLFRRRWKYCILLGVVSLLPLILYAAFSTAHGWYAIPNSVLLKGNAQTVRSSKDLIQFLFHSFLKIFDYKSISPSLIFLGIITLILFIRQIIRKKSIWETNQLMLFIFLATLFLQIQFAKTYYYFFGRYSAYLYALGLLVLSTTLLDEWVLHSSSSQGKNNFKSIAILLPILVLPIFSFVLQSEKVRTNPGLISLATSNIYDQQYHMGLFIKNFYQGETVAVNDIGAVNFLADFHCLDLWGIGTLEVAKEKKQGVYDRDALERLAKATNTKIAIVYSHWYEPGGAADLSPGRPAGLPAQWIPCGQWTLLNNVINGGSTVTFYAVDTSDKDNLISNLKTFEPKLPKQFFNLEDLHFQQ